MDFEAGELYHLLGLLAVCLFGCTIWVVCEAEVGLVLAGRVLGVLVVFRALEQQGWI